MWRGNYTFLVADVDHLYQPLPFRVKEELLAAFFLSSLAFMHFRQPSDPVVTASDVSESGGGLCASDGITTLGLQASGCWVRGQTHVPFQEGGVLAISVFDGIGLVACGVVWVH